MSAKKTTALAVLLVISVVAYILACSQATWSPDGKRIAFVDQFGDHEWTLTVWDTEAATLHRLLKSTTGIGPPSWSPDGKQLAVVNFTDLKTPQGGDAGNAYRLYLVNPVDGTPRLLSEANGPAAKQSDKSAIEPCLQWTGGGKMIVWPIPTAWQVRLVDAASGQLVKTIDNAIDPVISPSRKMVAMLENGEGDAVGLAILDLEKMERRTLLKLPTAEFRVKATEALAWSPDSSHLLIAGQPMKKAEKPEPGAEQWVAENTCSLWTVAVSDGKVVPLSKELPGGVSSVDWALKGDHIALTMTVKAPPDAENKDDKIGVWLMNADGTGLRRIDSDRSGKDMALLPTFSPDGSRLTYRLMQDKDQEPGMTVLIYDLATGKEKSFYSEAGQKMLPEFATAESATSTASATPASSAAPAK